MILVIDDHPLFCEALQMTLSESLGLPQVATAATLDAGLQALAAGPMADAIVLDLNLPDVAGLDGLTRLRNMAPGVPVVVVSSMSDDRIIAAVMHAGAAGFVPKHSPRDAFVAAIGTALQGGTYTPDGYTAPSASAPETAERSVIDRVGGPDPRNKRASWRWFAKAT